MRSLWCLVLVILLVAACNSDPPKAEPPKKGPEACSDPGAPAAIVEEALEQAIRDELGLNGTPTCSDMMKLEALVLKDAGVKSISGLEQAVNLERLDLESNRIEDITPLSGLANLSELNLDKNMIGDLSPLTGLLKLEWLWLGDNVINDLGPLAGLTNLRGLSLWSNYISDLSPVASLVNLERLYLCCMVAFDLSVLAGMDNLRELDISDGGFTSLAGLHLPASLDRLVLSQNRLTSIAELAQISTGTQLLIDRNYLTDAAAQAQLESLSISGVDVIAEPQYVPGEPRCEDWFLVRHEDLVFRNNVWNKQDIIDYEQCLLVQDINGDPRVGWAWRWPREDGRVKGYPEVAYGWASNLPRIVNDLEELSIDYAIEVEAEGIYNVAFDAWIRKEPKPLDDNPFVELMIWIGDGGMVPAGEKIATLTTSGVTFDMFVDDFPNWKYVAYQAQEDVLEGSVDVVPFLRHMVERGVISGSEYFTSLHLGNEVVQGEGEAQLSRFDVTFR